MAKLVKRAYRYRFYPSPEQTAELSRTFGCVRLVWNKALEARSQAWCESHKRISYVQSSAMLTQWKASNDLAFLNEVSSVPLQQALRHLQSAFVAFWTNGASESPASGRGSRRNTPGPRSAGDAASSSWQR
jgi:putative transposase